jgi:hypothetical protein
MAATGSRSTSFHTSAQAGTRHLRGNGRVPPGFSPLQSFYAYALRVPLVRLAVSRASQNSYDPGADLDRQLRAPLQSAFLCQLLTQKIVAIRLLGSQPQCRNADGLDHILYRQQSGHCRQPCPARLAVLAQCQMRAPSARRNPIRRRRRSQRCQCASHRRRLRRQPIGTDVIGRAGQRANCGRVTQVIITRRRRWRLVGSSPNRPEWRNAILPGSMCSPPSCSESRPTRLRIQCVQTWAAGAAGVEHSAARNRTLQEFLSASSALASRRLWPAFITLPR